MDEARLREVFGAAAGDPPPPGFDHADVVAASRRVGARRRRVVLGTAAALVVLAGAGVGVAALPGSDDARSAASAPAAGVPAPEAAAPPDAMRSGPAPGPPLGPGDPAGCADRQDPALRALVEQVLPEVADAPEAVTTMECRPGGERGLALEVTDAGTPGLLVVEYRPPGPTPRPDGGSAAGAVTASGGRVVVSSQPLDPLGPAPFEDRLVTLTRYLAERL